MDEGMRFPDTVEEFMKQYKVVDREGIYMSKGSELVPIFRMDQWFEHEKAQLSQEGTTTVAKSKRTFVELLVQYPHPDVCTYPEYKGKPYYSIKYIEDGECFVGFETYKPEVLSKYLKEYFMPPAQPEESTKKHTETHACDSISRIAVYDRVSRMVNVNHLDPEKVWFTPNGVKALIEEMPSAQPEHDAEFWRKRAEEYSNICLAMTAEMTKGIKFNSIRIDENGICFGKEQPEQKWIPCSERLPENRVSVIVCFREWQQYAKRYVYSIVVGWYARKHSVHENVFSDWEADCEYDEIEDESYINEGWYEFTTQGNGDLMNWYINADVIAWMPLPEPYKVGETT